MQNLPSTCKCHSQYLLVRRGSKLLGSSTHVWIVKKYILFSIVTNSSVSLPFPFILTGVVFPPSSPSIHPPLWYPIFLFVFCDHKYIASPTNLTQTVLSFFSCLIATIFGDYHWSWAGEFFHFHSPCITYSASALEANSKRKLLLPISRMFSWNLQTTHMFRTPF